MLDVLFFTHARVDTGFGHAARAGQLARLLKMCDPRLDIGFAGDFTPGARAFLAAGGAAFAEDDAHARVGVYDRMDDPEHPELWDAAALDAARARCARLVFMANGLSRPALPAGVIAIGYKPGGPPPSPPDLYWGLQYAPVAAYMLPEAPVAREPRRALVALGGAGGAAALATVLGALARIAEITEVDVLDSPVKPLHVSAAPLRVDQELTVHRGVARVTPLLARAGVVVASYGHLAYEALACGAPVCLVGLKRFQADYAARLAARGLAVAGGRLGEVDSAALTDAVRTTLAQADALSAAARRAVDGHGLDRVADLILNLCRAG